MSTEFEELARVARKWRAEGKLTVKPMTPEEEAIVKNPASLRKWRCRQGSPDAAQKETPLTKR